MNSRGLCGRIETSTRAFECSEVQVEREPRFDSWTARPLRAVDLADAQALDPLLVDLDARGHAPDVRVNNAGRMLSPPPTKYSEDNPSTSRTELLCWRAREASDSTKKAGISPGPIHREEHGPPVTRANP